jgi:hypothetical protein
VSVARCRPRALSGTTKADITAAFMAKAAGERREVMVAQGPVWLTDEGLAELQRQLQELQARMDSPGSAGTQALGILLGLVTTSSTAQPVMIATMLVLNVLGGLLVPLKAFPQWMRDAAYLLPSYHLGDLGWNAVASRAFHPADVLVLAGYGVVFAAMAPWRYRAGQARPLG